MNDKNLIPFGQRTKSEQREIAQKAGRASGKSRRRKAAVRKAVLALLIDVFPDSDGLTGEERLAAALFATACDSNNRNQVAAAKIILHLIGQDISPADEREQKYRIEKLKAETRKAEQGAEDFYPLGDDPISEAIRDTFIH